jgi:rRNA maturation endonuclease Nob1
MCGEVYGAEADGGDTEQGGAAEDDAPRQVECSLCDNPYEYPTLQECPMCGEAYGAVDEPPPAAANASGEPAPGSITAMLMQLQQSVAQQQQQQAADEQADNLQLQQLRLEEEEAKRPKSIEEEAKRMVMCGHCNHTYEYPTYNFCDNCGHPSSNASLRLSQIKRQTWSQGRQSMQIGAGAIEQMLAAAASGNGLQDPQQQLGMVNFCPDCGTSTDGGNQRFCGMCGKSFLGDEPALPGDCDAPTSPTSSSRYETGERDKLKRVSDACYLPHAVCVLCVVRACACVLSPVSWSI